MIRRQFKRAISAVMSILRRRQFVYGASATVSIFSILGILILINYLFFWTDIRFDLTEQKLYTVSEYTKDVLGKLNQDVEIVAFFKDASAERSEFQDLIKEYSRNSSHISADIYNPDQEPGLAKKFAIKEYSTVVLTTGDKSIKLRMTDPISGGILPNAEEEITNALLKLIRDIRKTVFFVQGHGERDFNDNTEAEGLGQLTSALRDEGYDVREFLFMQAQGLPLNNTIVILAAPKKALTLREIIEIKNYLSDGGNMIFLIEPRSGNEIVSILKGYGIRLGDDIIVDPNSKLEGGGDIAPIVATYSPHDITEDFRFTTIFPFSRSIELMDEEAGTILLAQTGEYSWAETDLLLFDDGVAQQDETDKRGPLGVAVVSENENRGRMAVFGSVDFVSNVFFDFSGNRDFFLNTINWVAGDENLIAINPRVPKKVCRRLRSRESRRPSGKPNTLAGLRLQGFSTQPLTMPHRSCVG